MDIINKLEELTINAWPALKTIYHEGWVIGLSGSYTRRANSVVPIYGNNNNLKDKIKFCENIYKKENQRSVFKITKNSMEIDKILESRGYNIGSESNVMTLNLTKSEFKEYQNVTFYNYPSEEWINGFNNFSEISSDNMIWHNKIISKIAPTALFALIRDKKGKPSGVGIGIIDNGYIGIFDLIIGKKYRKMGFGKQLLSAILAKAKSMKTSTSYLLVVKNNYSAISLYEKLGYHTIYNYWYRMKEM